MEEREREKESLSWSLAYGSDNQISIHVKQMVTEDTSLSDDVS